MRKQLADTREIEEYLQQQMPAASRLLFQVRMLLDPSLKEKVQAQRKVLQLVRWLGREEKKRQLDQVFGQLMQDETFHHTITTIFK
ncbi:hypothetical protein HGH93_07130 [Chitinophaga polysaccharea]|uniref:hypothetical protein n=1 Tax=Chitinophaga polysaccharea TaxID=1293035 RepID=UPI001454E9C4|nr:hypothetical protein [Chitinophaga polysaccharea]NLR57866.1 hypothetical protein [Chitinophaga polysaccharea]